MKYTNVFYINQIKSVSGITTWIKEIAKKYKTKDITLVYVNESDLDQLKEIKQNIRVIRLSDKIIECDRLFITNYSRDIKQFKAKEVIGVVHTNYERANIEPYKNVDKIIAVSKTSAEAYERISGIKPIVCTNPLIIDSKKILKLIYIGRLTKEKGKERIKALLRNLKENKINYLLTMITNEELGINDDNVIYLKPRKNARDYIKGNDYLIQLSDDDESFSYSINESLCLGVPIIATDLSCLKELGIKNKIHGYLIDFDMKNIPIEEIVNNIPKVEYKVPDDNWGTILGRKKSTYDPNKLIEVRCIRGYTDLELQQFVNEDTVLKVSEERAKELISKNLVEYEEYEVKDCKYKISIIIPMWEQEELIIRTLESIPARDNIETIVIDDYSRDNSVKVVKDYIKAHKNKNIKLLENKENKGVGYTFNRGLDNATGDYIIRIDSDDYFYTNQLNKLIDRELDGTDIIYYNLEDNNGRILDVTPFNRSVRCGAVKFIKRNFIGNTRCPEIRTAEDKAFNDLLLKKRPSEKYTNKTIYHYNYPREGSLYDLTKKGLL